jgi:hypothetical protein
MEHWWNGTDRGHGMEHWWNGTDRGNGMEHRWNGTDKVKPRHWEKNMSQCNLVHYKSHTDWPWIEPRPPHWQHHHSAEMYRCWVTGNSCGNSKWRRKFKWVLLKCWHVLYTVTNCDLLSNKHSTSSIILTGQQDSQLAHTRTANISSTATHPTTVTSHTLSHPQPYNTYGASTTYRTFQDSTAQSLGNAALQNTWQHTDFSWEMMQRCSFLCSKK